MLFGGCENDLDRRVLELKLDGYKASEIGAIIKRPTSTVHAIVGEINEGSKRLLLTRR